MKRRIPPAMIVIGLLAVIGIASQMYYGSVDVILAVIVFGGIFLLWKYPPNKWGQKQQRPSSSGRSRPQEKRKHVPFRVIQGNKRDDDDPDNPPIYH